MIGLLRLLRDHPGAVEADLQAVYGIDYRDRWRRDPDSGRVRLTFRRLAVLIDNLPSESSAVVLALHGEKPWNRGEVLLAHVWQASAQSKKPHPMLADAAKSVRRSTNPERQKKLNAGRRRARDRRRLIETGVIT